MIIAAKISMHLEQLGYEVTGILPRGEDAIVHCQQTAPDLLLLDINLNGTLDGIETAIQLQNKNIDIPIIYLTANADEGTFDRAKPTRPYAFISKPYKKIDLQRAIELAISRMENPPANITTVDTNSTAKNDPFILTDRIFIRHKNRMIKLFLKDIQYIEAERSYCRIMTQEEEFLLSMPLKNLAEKIEANHFFRIHRSHLVNLTCIDEIAETHIVVAGKVLAIGKSYKEAFMQRIRTI